MVKRADAKKGKFKVSPVVFWAVVGIAAFFVLLGTYVISNHTIDVYSVQVTNISPTSATIVWRTDRPTIGGSMIIEDEETFFSIVRRSFAAIMDDGIFWDSRDIKETEDGELKRGTADNYSTHHVTMYGLEPDTDYSFAVVNNNIVARQSDMYVFRTPEARDSLDEPLPVYGEIESDGTVRLEDTVVIAQIQEAESLDFDRYRSQLVSTVLTNGTYVLDMGNVYDSSLKEIFPSLFEDGDEDLDVRILILTPSGYVEHVVKNKMVQPVDTLVINVEDLEKSFLEQLIPDAFAVCKSSCIGDCQGCNKETPGEPLCVTYGCGYMAWCCGEGTDECDNHCINGKKDCGEGGVDCGGGGCPTCGDEGTTPTGDCPGQCVKYGGTECVPKNPKTGNCLCGGGCGNDWCPPCDNPGSHCFNRKQDQGETGVDCGGECAASCAKPGVEAPTNSSCTNEGEVFTCSDRPDWNCWCHNGVVEPHHSKTAPTNAQVASTPIKQEGKTSFFANSKFGIHTGMGPGAAYGQLLDGNVGYVMNVISEPGQLAGLIEEYKNLPDGVVPIVRFCHADNAKDCAFSDVDVAADFINQVAAATGKPVAVISGPNEPLQEPWTLPGGECSSKNCSEQVEEVAAATASWMNEFLGKTSSGSIIHLSPDLNTSEPDFKKFVNAMKAANADFSSLDGVAANAYEGAGGKSIADVVQELKDLGFSDIFLTEVGVDPYGPNNQSDDPANYDKVLNALMAVADDPAIMSMLLFNPLPGLNPDPEFDKHEYTDDQYNNMAEALSGEPVQSAPIAAGTEGVEVVETSQAGTGKSCTRGTCMEVCSEYKNGKPNSYVYLIDSPGCPDLAPHTNIEGVGYVNLLPGTNNAYSSNQSSMCFFIHDDEWANELKNSPEHNGICSSVGGGNVGVSPGQGNVPGINGHGIVASAHAADSNVEPGIYDVTGINVDVTTLTLDVLQKGAIRFFYDLNENGILDEGEKYLTNEEAETIEIELEKKTDITTYDVESGWNAYAVPVVMKGEETSEVVSASTLALYMRASGLEAVHVATYRNHEFLIYSQRVDSNGDLREYGYDFLLVPGEGYFVKSKNSGTFALSGYLPSEKVSTSLSSGWNLVGFFDPGEDYFSSFDLLSQMNTQGIKANVLTKWEGGKYVSSILDGDEYGTDFNVYRWGGYWVRVDAGESTDRQLFEPD